MFLHVNMAKKYKFPEYFKGSYSKKQDEPQRKIHGERPKQTLHGKGNRTGTGREKMLHVTSSHGNASSDDSGHRFVPAVFDKKPDHTVGSTEKSPFSSHCKGERNSGQLLWKAVGTMQ